MQNKRTRAHVRTKPLTPLKTNVSLRFTMTISVSTCKGRKVFFNDYDEMFVAQSLSKAHPQPNKNKNKHIQEPSNQVCLENCMFEIETNERR